jgi:hypothetical protein
MLDEYARDRDASRAKPPQEGERALFLGSRPIAGGSSREARLEWRWRLEEHRITAEGGTAGDALHTARRIAALLEEAVRGAAAADLYRELRELQGKMAAGTWRALRNGGLVTISTPPRPSPTR